MSRIGKSPRTLSVLAVLTIVIGRGALFVLDEPPPAPVPPEGTLTPIEYVRPADQTFLTFPEWFLVHSPAEYARYVAHASPTEFPFVAHVGQLWTSYRAVSAAIPEDQPPNVGYHVMILVIATSTTVEYGVRGLYETLVGRLAEQTEVHGRTPEEALGARIARDYVDFINVRPWYEFDFTSPLVELWTETPVVGPDLLRKLERRYALTTELAAKAGYGWLIGLGTAASYEAASPVTAVVLDRLPDDLAAGLDVEVKERFDDGHVLLTLPRYQAFSDHAAALAAHGANFVEVAGNRGPILVSVIGPTGFTLAPGSGDVLFRQAIETEDGRQRVVFTTPVSGLSAALVALADADADVSLEHVYDF